MPVVLFAIALCASLLAAALLALISFLLLPWAKQRFGQWSLALFPLSTFAGAYVGWAVSWLLMIKAA